MSLLPACLAALERQETPLRIIVIDDASDDATADWLKVEFPKADVIVRPTRGGFCQALLDGYKSVRTEFVAVINNDVEVQPGWARAGLDALERDPRIGSVACKVLQTSSPDQFDSAGDTYTFFGANEKRAWNRAADEEPRCKLVSAPLSAAFFRARALDDVGFVDPHFVSHVEDVDLGLRLLNAGWTCRYVPDAVALHRVNATYRGGSAETIMRISRNAEGVFWSTMPAPVLALGAPCRMVWITFQAIRHLSRGTFLPFIRGKFAFLSEWRFWFSRRRILRRRGKRHGDPLARGIEWNPVMFFLDRLKA